MLVARTEAVLPRDTIVRQGITLDQPGHLLALQPAEVALHHAAVSSVMYSGAKWWATKKQVTFLPSQPMTARLTGFSSSTSPTTSSPREGQGC